MTLNFDRVIITVDGSVIEESGEHVTVAKQLARILSTTTKPVDPVKFWDWSRSLYATGSITLDRSDFNLLKKFVVDLEGVSVLFKAQILDAFVLSD